MEEIHEVACVIAVGPNDIDKVVMIFKTEDEAKAHLNSLKILTHKISPETEEDEEEEFWTFDEIFMEKEDERLAEEHKKTCKESDKADYPPQASHCLLTNYYDGCGGISFFYVDTVEFGEVFTGWNLD